MVSILNNKLRTMQNLITPQSAICKCLEDGILRLKSAPLSTYIPCLYWDEVHAVLGPSPLYNHLLKSQIVDEVKVLDPKKLIEQIVLDHLDVLPPDFEHQIPFTSYGLDSLSAARLSTALKRYITITQMQLLADLTLDDLMSKVTNLRPMSKEVPPDDPTIRPYSWGTMGQAGQTILKLVDGYGTPLIIVHGGAGIVTVFKGIQEQFHTPLWALQLTEDTPVDSFDHLVEFYFRKIKEARPFGGIRLAGYSASSIIILALARLFEKNGDELLQLAFVDHFPLLFASPGQAPAYELEDVDAAAARAVSDAVKLICDTYAQDPNPARRLYGVGLATASRGGLVTPDMMSFYNNIRSLSALYFSHLVETTGGDSSFSTSDAQAVTTTLRHKLVEKVNTINAPITVYIATDGLRAVVPSDWQQLGVELCRPGIRSILHDATHFNIFENPDFARSLERDWTQYQNQEFPFTIRNPAKNILGDLFAVLDSMALEVMAATIDRQPSVGSEVCVQDIPLRIDISTNVL
jgi:hypothetical protein